jgi:hypothetical protein
MKPSPSLYREIPTCWAVPDVQFVISSPCVTPFMSGAAMQSIEGHHIGTNWTDGSITIQFNGKHNTYEIR